MRFEQGGLVWNVPENVRWLPLCEECGGPMREPHRHPTAITRELRPALDGSRAAARRLPPPSTKEPGHPDEDRLLSPAEAAERLGVRRRWILEHADEIPGSRRLSRKTIRFSERALSRYLAGRASGGRA